MKICNFLGELSYPLYLTHFPFIYMQINWVHSHPDAPLYAHAAVSAGVFIFAVLLAYAVLKAYDSPVREWLRRRWLKASSR